MSEPVKKKKKKKSPKKKEAFDLELVDFGDEPEELASLAVVTQVDSIELPSVWGQTAANVDEIRKARSMYNMKHGFLANVPMICKDTKCPLKDVCSIAPGQRPMGQRCPVEIAAIITLYDRFVEALQVGDDYFAQSQIKDLVDTEVKLLRAGGVLASADHFIEDVAFTVDGNGDPVTAPQLHKATEYEEKLLARKRQILGDLMATRKSKKEEKQVSDPSSFASTLMAKAMKAMQQMPIVVDGDYEDVNSDTVDEEV
ncbi:hypothetical protein ACK8P5_25830 (plasmid) [Paenibacillus sp. EC2-1]|uniref:hypothetical protein n=1 Tax=Paenibacillus sp. EC2-1 TaxID=3388665 RepID=UPI003BEED4E4